MGDGLRLVGLEGSQDFEGGGEDANGAIVTAQEEVRGSGCERCDFLLWSSNVLALIAAQRGASPAGFVRGAYLEPASTFWERDIRDGEEVERFPLFI